MATDAKRLHYAIVEYLTSLKSNTTYDAESIDVALPLLTEVFGVHVPNDAATLKASTHALPDVFAAGVSAMAAAAAAPAVGPFVDPAEEKKFAQFVQLLTSSNFFAGCDVNATGPNTDYARRLTKARVKYIEKWKKDGKPVPAMNLSGSVDSKSETAAAPAAAAKSSPAPMEKEVDEDADLKGPAPDENTKKEAEAAKEAGNRQLTARQFRAAITHYSQAIQLNPRNVVYWSNRAQAYINLKEWDAAIKDANKAVRIDTKYYKAHYRLGVAYQGLNRHTDAVQAFEAALRVADKQADTESIRDLLAQSKAKLGGGAAAGAGAGGFDFASLMSNPAIQGLMNNPAMAGLMNNPALANMMGGGGGGGGAGAGGMPDLSALMRDPNIMNMAQGLMADPNMASMLGGLMGGAGGAGAGSGAAAASSPSSSSSSSGAAAAASGPSEFYTQIMAVPAIAALKDDPALIDTFADIEVNGKAAISRALAKPAVMAKLSSVLPSLMASMGGAGGSKA